MSNNPIWSECQKCNRSTKHNILGQKNIENKEFYYHHETKYYLLECNGCESISFRKEFYDYDSVYQVGPDEYEYDKEIEVFPHKIDGHNEIKFFNYVPNIVENIYKESLLSIQEGAFTLAGLGLRATIEAICNHKEIIGKNLQVRINNMHKKGLISKADADRLHAIRFMGNDAAHEIKKAKKQSVLVALKIIEHIILSVYIFEKEVNIHLEKPITSLDDVVVLLESNLKEIQVNTSFTFSKWLGSSARRILEKSDELEEELIIYVREGKFKGVELSESPDSSDSSTQWFKKNEEAEEKSEDLDDIEIPF